jgi:NitT/TauT family transport system substrate-binding protein
MPIVHSRRRFLTDLAFAGAAGGLAGVGASGLIGASQSLAAEPPPETTSVRIPRFVGFPATCLAPMYAAEEFLRAEGFTDLRYIDVPGSRYLEAVGRGTVDFAQDFAVSALRRIDAGDPMTLLAGLHVGCFEGFANDSVRSVRDLKGKRVGVFAEITEYWLLKIMAAYVGLDPARDIHWVNTKHPIDLFEQGKIDAYATLAAETFDIRARKLGRSFINTAIDRPWSQYFCCVFEGNREFVRKYPVATKRVVRAMLKATDLCVSDPARVARRLVDRGITYRYDYALQTMNELPYNKWRDYDVEDSVRFYALRMHETGLIKSAPSEIISDACDWRFLNELKRELKA